VQTLLLSTILTPVLDAIADRASRPLLGRVASRTLWGTLTTRIIAWSVAWMVTRRTAVPRQAHYST
jgi:hypothetical protein